DHSTISAAIKAAKPGARILIRPGTYTENLVLDKPLELIGEGERDEVLVAVTSGDALRVSASLGLVRNMRFLRGQGKGNDVAAWVTAGRCVFEDCSFTCRSLSAVVVKGAGTAPGFDRCRFEGSAQGGASVLDHATPRFEECRFSDNDLHGIGIVEKADPELRRCVMRQNTQVGAFVYKDGRGRFTDCDFAQNGFDGVATEEGGAPHLKNCRLIDNQQWGFSTEDKDGGGTVEDCLFRGNARGAWNLTEGSEGRVVRRDNREE
ncbi:MAG: hypothetical protein GY717_02500, partial [Rhodobacteraceae bacterium]|nr:hypothetical protein [Paracoccaceae bacterium]